MYKTVKIKKRVWALLLILLLSAGFLLAADAYAPRDGYENRYPQLYAERGEQTKPPKAVKTVYITFDDGPSKVTPDILDTLKELDVKATFFVIGRTGEQDIQTLKRIHSEGHSIGAHSYSHKYHEIYQDVESYLDDFNEIENWIYEITGEHTEIFRFPGGSNNSTAKKSMMTKIATEMTRRGYTYFDWNVIAHDDRKTVYSAEQLFQNVVKSAKGKLERNLVILFHDNSTRTTTVEVLPRVIDYFKEQGYVFDRLTPAVNPIQFNKPKTEK